MIVQHWLNCCISCALITVTINMLFTVTSFTIDFCYAEKEGFPYKKYTFRLEKYLGKGKKLCILSYFDPRSKVS